MRLMSASASMLLAAHAACAQTIYPLDRAEILRGAKFDLKVEFPAKAAPDRVKVTVNGVDHATTFGRAAIFIEREDGKDQSAVILRDVALQEPGTYRLLATDGTNTREVAWTVYDTGPRQARNVILFIGDGLSLAHRVAARYLSKGIAEGKAKGRLAIDDMPHMALVATAGSDSIITDSANSASAYATGHKTATNAMGVYADRTENPFDDPRVETVSSLVRRRHGMAVGIVTNTEVADATPAAMIAHTRRRAAFDQIVEQFYAAKPEVLMGGGAANFLPRGATGARRQDDADYIRKFLDAGYAVARTGPEMTAAASASDATKLLGLFHTGAMDGVLDRRFLKGGTVKRFPEQPDLTAQMQAALDVLSRNDKGFFLMVESGMIDRYSHALDMERAVYETIMLDNAVQIAKDWAAKRGHDTMILVVGDHAHPLSLIGTIDDDMASTPNVPLRNRVATYNRAEFPNYPDPDQDGYPPRVDASRRLAIFSAAVPDHYETFRPKLDEPNDPTAPAPEPRTFEANSRYRNAPGAMLRPGNLPNYLAASVHSGEDVILTATGPGSERVRGQIDNTELFRIMAEALGLGHGD